MEIGGYLAVYVLEMGVYFAGRYRFGKNGGTVLEMNLNQLTKAWTQMYYAFYRAVGYKSMSHLQLLNFKK